MITHDTHIQRKTAYYIEQLNKLGYYDTDNLSYAELKQKLTVARMKHIDYSSADNEWFR